MVSIVRSADRADSWFASTGNGLASVVALCCDGIDCMGVSECGGQMVSESDEEEEAWQKS